MDVLLDQKTMVPLLLGAALALLGGIITQLIFWRASLSHNKTALLTAFRAELKVIRGNLGSSIAGYRESLQANDPPTPTVFVTSTPVFDANAGNLGQLKDTDLVEHIVEVYSGLHALSELACLFKNITNTSILLSDFNSVHLSATTAHLQVMNLHNRLTGIGKDKESFDYVELDTRKHFAENTSLLQAGKISVILAKRWHGG